MSDFIFQAAQQATVAGAAAVVAGQNNNVTTDVLESGSPENHRPYIPKYSLKDENLLRRVDLTSLESINATFFPEEYQKGKVHWVVVPKHVLGIDTDFSFVAKKLDEYRQLERVERQRELARWDKMARWERNMYEDRIAILMQQKILLEEGGNSALTASNGSGGVLTSRGIPVGLGVGGVSTVGCTNANNKRPSFAMAVKPTAAATPTISTTDAFVAATAASIANYSEVPDSKRRCIRMKPPIPSRYQGDIEAQKDTPVPEFISLMNFPALSLPDGLRCCVMCGQACPTSAAMKSKKMAGGCGGHGGGGGGRGSKSNAELAFIPTQNKGLCTLCDVNVWVISSTGMEIKWCKGCKNFRCWAAFGDKGHATKCLRCRERQREKYAAQKEEKEKGISGSSSSSGRTPTNKKGNN